MDVKFVTTTRELVDTVPISDGQVIACKDHDDFFYDMSQIRHRVGRTMWEPVDDDNLTPGFMMKDAMVGAFEFDVNNGSDVLIQEGSPANFVIGTPGAVVEYTTLPETRREGYKFLGWYEDQTTQGTRVEVFPSKYPSGKTIYYASWQKL